MTAQVLAGLEAKLLLPVEEGALELRARVQLLVMVVDQAALQLGLRLALDLALALELVLEVALAGQVRPLVPVQLFLITLSLSPWERVNTWVQEQERVQEQVEKA